MLAVAGERGREGRLRPSMSPSDKGIGGEKWARKMEKKEKKASSISLSPFPPFSTADPTNRCLVVCTDRPPRFHIHCRLCFLMIAQGRINRIPWVAIHTTAQTTTLSTALRMLTIFETRQICITASLLYQLERLEPCSV